MASTDNEMTPDKVALKVEEKKELVGKFRKIADDMESEIRLTRTHDELKMYDITLTLYKSADYKKLLACKGFSIQDTMPAAIPDPDEVEVRGPQHQALQMTPVGSEEFYELCCNERGAL